MEFTLFVLRWLHFFSRASSSHKTITRYRYTAPTRFHPVRQWSRSTPISQ